MECLFKEFVQGNLDFVACVRGYDARAGADVAVGRHTFAKAYTTQRTNYTIVTFPDRENVIVIVAAQVQKIH